MLISVREAQCSHCWIAVAGTGRHHGGRELVLCATSLLTLVFWNLVIKGVLKTFKINPGIQHLLHTVIVLFKF